jgi:hypothetical protein
MLVIASARNPLRYSAGVLAKAEQGERMDEGTEKLIEGKYLSVCSPDMAYQWLSARAPQTSVYRNAHYVSSSGPHEHFEEILLERNDPLIDYGLARHGWSSDVAEKLYDRLDHAGRCTMRACHLAGGGPPEPFEGIKEFTDELLRELIAWVYNPNHSDEFFEGLFNRSGVFERLTDKHFQILIHLAGRNQRLSTPYESLYLDGFDDYRYHQVFAHAWNMTLWVPTTQAWAGALEALLQNMVRGAGNDFDVGGAIERWRIDEKQPTADKWYENSRSFFLRSIIADLQKADDQLLNSQDLALRFSFYRRFNPHQYEGWPKFLENDASIFFQGLLQNMNVWKDQRERERLAQVAWDVPDPRHNMDAPNNFRAREDHLRKQHPDWFEEE